jgi:hypothetical protein
MSNLQEWINAALLVAEAEGMANSEVIPTWPADCVDRFPDRFPQLTVGALREWQAASAQDGGEPVAWLCIRPDGEPWGAVTNQVSVDLWMRLGSLGRTVCPLYTRPPSAVVPEGLALVPAIATREIEDAIGRNRNLKASEIWEVAVSVASKNVQQPSAVVPDWEIEAKRAFWSGLEIGASMGSVAILPRWDEYIAKRKGEISARPISVVVPEGWKRVPLKPTSEMMFAPAFGAVTGTLKPSTFSDIYQAMIAAAPQPPEQEQES